MDDVPSGLVEFTDAVLASAIDTATQVGVPFPAFVMLEDDNGRSLHRIATQRLEESVHYAQQLVASRMDAHRAAIVIDAFVPYEGRRWDAIVVQVFDHANQIQWNLAQRYEKTGLLRKKAALIDVPFSFAN